MNKEQLVTFKNNLQEASNDLVFEKSTDPIGIIKSLIDLIIAIVDKLIDNPDNNK